MAVCPENAVELSEANKLAVLHWRECKAVGEFPDDELVRRHAAVIQSVYDEFHRFERSRELFILLSRKK